MTIGPLITVLAVMLLWLGLVNSWRLRNWRAATLTLAGTMVIVMGGLLPDPARVLVPAVAWLLVAWVLLRRSSAVGVMPPPEYDYVDAHVKILRRIDRRKHAPRRLDQAAYVRAFEADVRALRALKAPPAWSRVHADTVRELDRRVRQMKTGVALTADEQRAANQRWLEVGQAFRDLLRSRAGFWTGWPHLVAGPEA
jgi:hypothetical protein